MINSFKEFWINGLPVDPRQRRFAYLIAAVDLLTIILAAGRYFVAAVVCFAAMTVVVVVAQRMKKKWRDQAAAD